MLMKIELLISHHHNKISFVPPETPYDTEYMRPWVEEDHMDILKPRTQYRVRTCLNPALIMGVA